MVFKSIIINSHLSENNPPSIFRFYKNISLLSSFFRYRIITFNLFHVVRAVKSVSLKLFIFTLLGPVITDEMILVFFHDVIISFGELKIKEYFWWVLNFADRMYFSVRIEKTGYAKFEHIKENMAKQDTFNHLIFRVM